MKAYWVTIASANLSPVRRKEKKQGACKGETTYLQLSIWMLVVVEYRQRL
jgi:hypothetical protein